VSAGGTAIVFVEAIYPERNIVFLLLVSIVALERFDEHPSSGSPMPEEWLVATVELSRPDGRGAVTASA
jgi:hypothetical protein